VRNLRPMKVEIATTVTPALVDAVERLVPQLSRSNPPPSIAQLEEIVAAPATDLFVATLDDGTVAGMSTLVSFRIPTGVRSLVEDVVVDTAARGAGVGTALAHAMLDRARELGAVTVDLTSRPSREAANRLYQHIGFKQRETNVYRYALGSPE
jgi:ribosomal protein S18 acetylase RimI-like enzyme